jgi:predicted DNA-binding transcriptional regulator AlpA
MQTMKYADLVELPTVVDITTAARALGLSRTYAYHLAKHGDFPCKVIRIGTCYRVPTAALRALLDAAADR